MRVAIYGTGGAGGYFGAHLARTGEDVTFVARGQHLKGDSSARFVCRNISRGDCHTPSQSDGRSNAGCSRGRDFARGKSLAGRGGCEKYAAYGRASNARGPAPEWS